MLIHMLILLQFLYMLEKRKKQKITFIHINASLQCFSFLIRGIGVIMLSILDSILKFAIKVKNTYANPDWHGLDADPNPDPAKCCGSVRIRIHNTASWHWRYAAP